MADASTPPDLQPRQGLTQKMVLAGKQAEKLRQRAEALKKFAQRYKDSSAEQSQYAVPHRDLDP